MNIHHQEIEKQYIHLFLEIQTQDYKSEVNTILREKRRTAQLPGFRAGKVPLSVVKSKIGNAVTAQEVQKLVSSSINNYIKDNKLEIIGYPLPLPTNDNNDWDNPSSFRFEFEMGLRPVFDFEINSKLKLIEYSVEFKEKELKKYFSEKLLSRYNDQKFIDQVSSKENIITGKIYVKYPNEKGDLEGVKPVVEQNVIFPVNKIKSRGTQKLVLNSKIKEEVQFLGKDVEGLPNINLDVKTHKKAFFVLEIEKISEVIPAQINQELFDKIYGKDKIKDELEFFKKVEKDIKHSLVRDTDIVFIREMFNYLIKKSKPYLSDKFLKKWLKKSSEQNKNAQTLTDEVIEKELEEYKKNILVSLLRNYMVTKLGLEVTKEDLIYEAEKNLKEQFLAYGMQINNQTQEQIKQLVPQVLQNREQVENLSNQILDKKLLEKSKELFSIKYKKVSLSDFEKIIKS